MAQSVDLLSCILEVTSKLGKATSDPVTLWKTSKAITNNPPSAKAVLGLGVGSIVAFFGCGGSLRVSNGHVSVFMPLWIYDVCCTIMWWPNWAIGACCYSLNALPFQTSPDWNTDKTLSVKAIQSSPEALNEKALGDIQISLVQETSGWLKERDLIQLFDSLPAASPEHLIGVAFRGRIVRSGRFLDIVDVGLVSILRFVGFKWGKRYRTQYVGDPLCVTFAERFHFPLPIWGNVGMHGVNYRGLERATMAYDLQPWQDMFAVLDDGSVSGRRKFLGNWCHRTKCGGWFTLEEMPDIDVTL